ncbi:MAG TPA: twin-arginine translocation signal domain-containing protein [Bacteroidetes bacterium]|nr:twin-arginine translocation signal domain-containing protein [Bacteroidota bacterium]
MKNFSRRNFLKTTTMSSAAAVIAGCSGPVNNEAGKMPFTLNKNPLKLGLMTYMLGAKWDIETIIKNLTETGYQSVELRTTHAHGVEVTLSASERAEVRKRFEDSALEEISLASAFQYHSPDKEELKANIEGTKEYILLAEDIGAKSIRVFPNALPEGVSEEQTLKQIGKALAEVGKFGYEHGVKIKVCVHGYKTARVPVIKKIIDYSESPHVYVNWNCNLSDTEGEGLEYNFNLLKDRIVSLHMHELWDNRYPYRKLFELLADSGFNGYCNAEIPGSSDPIRILRYYRALFLSLQNAY